MQCMLSLTHTHKQAVSRHRAAPGKDLSEQARGASHHTQQPLVAAKSQVSGGLRACCGELACTMAAALAVGPTAATLVGHGDRQTRENTGYGTQLLHMTRGKANSLRGKLHVAPCGWVLQGLHTALTARLTHTTALQAYHPPTTRADAQQTRTQNAAQAAGCMQRAAVCDTLPLDSLPASKWTRLPTGTRALPAGG